MLDESTLSRRELFIASAGYALAASPITAWAISTPEKDLEAGDVVIPVGSERLPAYRAMPKKGGSLPVILVVHEIFGVHEYIKDVCRRFAKEGYLAIAPSLFFRQGDATKVADIETLRAQIVSKASQAQVLSDFDSTLAWVGKERRAATSRAAVTGFCWGGTATWLYAAHNPKLRAGVAWYGRLAGEATSLQPRFPLDVAADLKVPVLGLYGEKDQGIPLDQVEKMRQSLGKGKSRSEIEVYPGAQHGFHADYRPSYHEKAAKDAWKKALAWLRKHGA